MWWRWWKREKGGDYRWTATESTYHLYVLNLGEPLANQLLRYGLPSLIESDHMKNKRSLQLYSDQQKWNGHLFRTKYPWHQFRGPWGLVSWQQPKFDCLQKMTSYSFDKKGMNGPEKQPVLITLLALEFGSPFLPRQTDTPENSSRALDWRMNLRQHLS